MKYLENIKNEPITIFKNYIDMFNRCSTYSFHNLVIYFRI